MKKNTLVSALAIAIAAAMTLTLTMTSCSEEEITTMVTSNPTSGVKGTWAKAERPNWVKIGAITPSAMFVIVDETGLPTTVNDGDILAAFVGNECRGITTPITDRYTHFNLSIETKDDSDDKGENVELRYYSADKGGIYTAEPFAYEEGKIWGTIGKGNGYVPSWK